MRRNKQLSQPKSKPKNTIKIPHNQQDYSVDDNLIAAKHHQMDRAPRGSRNCKLISLEPSTHIDKESLWEPSNAVQHPNKNRIPDLSPKKKKNDTKRRTTRNEGKHGSSIQQVGSQPETKKTGKTEKTKTSKKQRSSKNQKQELFIKESSHPMQKKQEVKHEIKKQSEDQRKNGKLLIDLSKKSKSREENYKATVRPEAISKNNVTQLKEMPSFREYCVIKGKFIPLQSTTQRKQLQNILVNTACTSSISAYPYRYQQQLSRRASEETERIVHNKETNEENQMKIIKNQLAHFAVLVKAAHEEIGVQYSERLSANSSRRNIEILKELKNQNPSLKQNRKDKEKQSEIRNLLHQELKSDRSVLLEAMIKLESLEVSEKAIFDKLNIDQKRHFRQIFSSILSQMKSPRVESPPIMIRNLEPINEISFLKGDKKSELMADLEETKNQQLENLLMMRESRQNNQFNIVLRSPEHVDTSALAVIACFTDLICYIQMNFEHELLRLMNGLYGLSYNDKYRCISKYYQREPKDGKVESAPQLISLSTRIKIEIAKRQSLMRILPDSLFNSFMEEVMEEVTENKPSREKNVNRGDCIALDSNKEGANLEKSYFWIHCQAIFDTINDLLMPYRPFYSTKGDPFPWTLSPLKCLTFYSIDSDSLDTVVEQVQEKLTAITKVLCGLHIDSSIYKATNYQQKEESGIDNEKDVVYSMRREKLTKCLIQQRDSDGEDDPYLEFEIENTCVLHEIGLAVNRFILDEAVSEIFFLLY